MKQLIFQKYCKLDEFSAEISKTDSEYLTLLIKNTVPAIMSKFCKRSNKKLLKIEVRHRFYVNTFPNILLNYFLNCCFCFFILRDKL